MRELIDHQVEEQRWIDGVLLHIGNANERAVIRMRYVDAKSWPNVSKMIFGRNEDYEEKADSYLRRTTKLHGRALVDMATYISEHEM